MAVYQYAEQFTQFLAQKYEKELCSDALLHSNPQITFLTAIRTTQEQQVSMPALSLMTGSRRSLLTTETSSSS